MKLVASMIVRNEFNRYLPLAVEHLLGFCSEIRILDDGSDDGTFEWLNTEEQFWNGVRVERNTGPTFYEYESKARQELLEWTMEGKPDYVLSIDADEFVGNPELLLAAMRAGKAVATLDMEEVWRADDQHLYLRVDGLWGPRRCPILWQAPARLTREWDIPDRKLACGREPTRVRRTRFVRSGSSIYHFGWAIAAERQARAGRYFEHDQGKFHQDRHLQSILWPDEKIVTTAKKWAHGLEPVRERLLERVSR